jgi:hypothetical protein
MQLGHDREVPRTLCGFLLLLDQLLDERKATATYAPCPARLGDRILSARTSLDGSANGTV